MTRKNYFTLVFALMILAISVYFWQSVQAYVLGILAWVDTLGIWAPIVFIGMVAMSVPMVFPGIVFTLAAGFMFGFIHGVIYIVLGLSMGGVISFLLGRYVLRDKVLKLLQRHASMYHLESEVTRGGGKLIMFTRMIPMFPYKVSNYVFGCTRVKLWEFWLGNTIGILPLTFTNVYVGSLAVNLTSMGDRDAPLTTTEWVLSLGGLACAVVGLIYITRYAQRAIRAYQEEGGTA